MIISFKAIIEKCLLILWRHIDFYLSNFDLSQSDGAQLFKNDLYSGSVGLAESENLRRLGKNLNVLLNVFIKVDLLKIL